MVIEKSNWKEKDITLEWIENLDDYSLKNIRQVSGICFDETNKILLIKNTNKKNWSIPGGTPENNETIKETLIREIEEEASCEILNLKLLGGIKVNFPNNPNKKEGENFLQLRFKANISKIKKQTIDPDKGIILDRIFINPKDFLKYINYNKKINGLILNKALKKTK